MTLQPGDAASWVEAIGTWASLGMAYWVGRRQERAVEWGRRVDELAGLAADEVLRRLRDDEDLEEVFWDAIEAASRLASRAKREALAKAVAAALRGDVADLDVTRRTTRTIVEVDAPHVQLLVRIASSSTSTGAGWDELVHNIGTATAFYNLTGTLEREGLIRPAPRGHEVEQTHSEARFVITGYGQHLLSLLKPLAATETSEDTEL